MPKRSAMHSQPEISPLILKRLTAALEPQIVTDVEMHSESLNSSQSQPSLQDEQELVNATESIKEEAQGPPQIEQAQVAAIHPESPSSDAQAPTLQNVQETEAQQNLLPQEQHDVPPTLQNELPIPHHNDERVRPVLAPVSPTNTVTTEVHHRAPSPMESLMDPTIAIPPQLLVKPSTISPPLNKVS